MKQHIYFDSDDEATDWPPLVSANGSTRPYFSFNPAKQRHAAQNATLIDVLRNLPAELFCEHIWPCLSLQTQCALFCSCRALRQFIASHFVTRLVLAIDLHQLRPVILPRAALATKLSTLYMCFCIHERHQHECRPQLHLKATQEEVLARILTRASQQANPIHDLTVNFSDAFLCAIMHVDSPAPLLLSTKLLESIICNFRDVVHLTLTNFTTVLTDSCASDGQAAQPLCSLVPLQHARNLVSVSFQQGACADADLTWAYLCTLPCLPTLQRLEISSIRGPVTQQFPHTLPALTHVAFTSTSEYAYSQYAQMELLRKQRSIARIHNLQGWSTQMPQAQGVIEGLQSVQQLTIIRELTQSLAKQLGSVAEICTHSLSLGSLWADASKLPWCKKLCVTRVELWPNHLRNLLDAFPCLERLEVSIFSHPEYDVWQEEVEAYFRDRSLGLLARLRDSGLTYLHLQLVQNDSTGMVDTYVLADLQRLVSEFPFEVELTTIRRADFVALRNDDVESLF